MINEAHYFESARTCLWQIVQFLVKLRENKPSSSSQSHALVWTVLSTTKRSHPGLDCVVRDLEATRHTNRVCGGTPGYLSPWKLANFLPRGQGRNRRINHFAIRYWYSYTNGARN